MLRLHGDTGARCKAELQLVNFRSYRSALGLELNVNSLETDDDLSRYHPLPSHLCNPE